MSADFEITADLLEKAERMLEGIPGASKKAVARALNRALTSGRSAGVQAVRDEYTIKASDVRSSFGGLKRATRSNLAAELRAQGYPLPLSMYSISPQSDTTGGNRAQVRAAVKKGGLKPLGSAFIAKGFAVQRLGSSRYPLEVLYGPSVPGLLNNEQVVDAVTDKMRETAEKRLDHEILRILEGAE